MVGESNQSVLLIQIDALSLTEFEISEFEILRVDCMYIEKSLLLHLEKCPFVLLINEKVFYTAICAGVHARIVFIQFCQV